MKKPVIKIIILIFIVHVVASCNDEINSTPISNPNAANFYRNAADMEIAVTGAYSALQTIGQYAHSYPFLMEVRSDNSFESDKGSSGGIFHRVDILDMSPANRVLAHAWRDGYAGIQRTNIVLNRIDGINDMDAVVKAIRVGEMKFLRALTYFNLVRIFGDVPLVLRTMMNLFLKYNAIIANGLGNGKGEGSPFPSLFGPLGGSPLIGGGQTLGNNAATQDLFDAYRTSDLRRDINIGNLGGKLYPAKLMGIVVGDIDSDVNSIVLRYADVVLMLAEALNEQEYVKHGEAFDLVNQVRIRAGLAKITSADVANQSTFRLAVEQERRLELAFENQQWFDLVRTKRAMAVMNAHGKSNPKTMISK